VPKRALVVDNDKFCVELLSDILIQAGYEIAKAYDGLEAMDALHRTEPDVVFLDMVMPKVDGDQVLRYIKENPATRHIPVVIVSGTLVEDQEKLIALGADGYVAKGRARISRGTCMLPWSGWAAGRPVRGRASWGRRTWSQGQGPRTSAHPPPPERILRTIGEGVVILDEASRIMSVNRAPSPFSGSRSWPSSAPPSPRPPARSFAPRWTRRWRASWQPRP